MDNNGHSFWSILGVFALGAAAGSMTALLLAPRSGTEMRSTLASLPNALRVACAQGKEAGLNVLNEGVNESTAP
jgi:gas vesicle protein